MADYTDQSTDSLLPGEPWTSAKALACFENPVAIAEGASGAPKIQTAAYGAQTVNETAMKVQQFSAAVDLTQTRDAGDSATIVIPGNLVFLPRLNVTYEGVIINPPFVDMRWNNSGNLEVYVESAGGDDPVTKTVTATVSWYRIIP